MCLHPRSPLLLETGACCYTKRRGNQTSHSWARRVGAGTRWEEIAEGQTDYVHKLLLCVPVLADTDRWSPWCRSLSKWYSQGQWEHRGGGFQSQPGSTLGGWKGFTDNI